MAVFVNSGIAGQIVYAAESTYGTAASLTSAAPLEFTSETLELKKTTVQGAGLHAGGLFYRGARRAVTMWTVSGGITMDLPTEYIHGLLLQMMGSVGTGTVSGSYTQYVYTPGSLVGRSLTIQKAAAPTYASSGTALATAANPFTEVGCKITDWTISVATGALAQLAITVDGRNELGQGYASTSANYDTVNTAAPALATFTEDATNNVFFFRQANLLTGAVTTTSGVSSIASPTTIAAVKSASVQVNNSLDTSRYFLGSAGFKAEPIENNFRKISGQLQAEFNLTTPANSATLYQNFAGDTPLALELQFQALGGTPGASPGLTILIPQVYLEGESPKVNGPAVIDLTVPFTGLDDGTDNPIQITYTSLTADAG